MSFARVSSKQNTARQVSGSTKTKKLKARRKPAWDNTVNDLTAFKATPEELDRRKEVHRSQNADVLKEEQLKKKIAKARQKSRLDDLAVHRGSAGLLQEILLDNSQLEETLVKSDTLLSAVRSILSDHKRVQGLPNVTQAPTNSKAKMASGNGLFEVPVSHLDELSDSVMDKRALNEDLDHSSSSSDSEEAGSAALDYQPAMDLARFQRLIHELDQVKGSSIDGNNDMLKTARIILNQMEQHTGKMPTSTVDGGKQKRTVSEAVESKQIAEEETPISTPVKDRAINDTARVNQTRARFEQDSTTASTGTTMEDFYKVLETVNNNLSDYERQTGRVGNPSGLPTASCSGYTKALLDAVVRMSCYFKENVDRLSAESALRERLLQEVKGLNGLVDTLSKGIISMQEAYARLQNEFVKSRRETEQQLLIFRKVLALNGIIIPTLPVQPQGLGLIATNASGQVDPATSRDSTAFNNGYMQTGPLDKSSEVSIKHVSMSSLQRSQPQATMLLPPQQMDSPTVTSGKQTHHATQNLDGVRGALHFEGEMAPPLTKNPQDSNLSNHQIGDSLQAQSDPFSQQSKLPLGVLHHQSSDVHHGRPVLLHSLAPENRNFQPSGSQQFTVNGERRMEQRNVQNQLAEINRQQAEAQRKLQELIERQQQEVKGAFMKQTVSPSISPITIESEKLPVTKKFDSMKSSAVIMTEMPSNYKEENPTVQMNPALQLQNAGPPVRQIKVNVPQAAPPGDELLGNSPDLIQDKQVKRVSGSSGPVIGKTSHHVKPQDPKNGGFFALTSHIPAL